MRKQFNGNYKRWTSRSSVSEGDNLFFGWHLVVDSTNVHLSSNLKALRVLSALLAVTTAVVASIYFEIGKTTGFNPKELFDIAIIILFSLSTPVIIYICITMGSLRKYRLFSLSRVVNVETKNREVKFLVLTNSQDPEAKLSF